MARTQKLSSAALLAIALLIAAAAFPGRSQSAQLEGRPQMGAIGVRQTVSQIMAIQAAQSGVPQPAPMLMPEHETHIPPKRSNPRSPLVAEMPELPPGFETQGQTGILSPQVVGTSFTGATLSGTNPTSAFPPDCMGAVGPTQYVVMVNNRIVTFNKTTGVADGVLNVTTNTFFNSVRNASGTSDPRIRYDRLSGRWFLLIINVSTPNRILIGVSDAASAGVISPSTVFTFFFLNIATQPPVIANTCLMDYPTLGIDANALYIGGNNFCGTPQTFNSTDGWVIRKSSILGAGPIVATVFRALIVGPSFVGPYTPQGVDNYDPASTEGYFIGVDGATYGTLMMRRVSNPGGTPSISGNVAITVPATAAPLTVPHLGNTGGTNGFLDPLDDRLFAAHIRNGRLWTAHNIGVNNAGSAAGTTTRNGSRWYELDVPVGSGTPTIVQSGTVFTASVGNTTDQRHYWIPSILVSGQGHAALGFSTAGANERANAATVGRLSGDALGTTQSPVLFTSSSTAYNPPGDTGASRGARRWGDYSYVALDPLDDMTMWTVQEFCDATNSYGVRVAKLIAPAPATPSALADVTAGQSSLSVTLTGTSISGTGYYDPGADLPGVPAFSHLTVTASNGGATGTPPAVLAAAYVDPATINLLLDASSATPNVGSEKYTLTVTNPDGQTRSAAVLHVVSGTPSVSIAPTSVSEGNAGTTAAQFTVTLSSTTPNSVTVNYQTSDGTATVADGDYQSATSTIVIPPNTPSGSITINVNGDGKRESNETFGVSLTGATNATIGSPSLATGTILNDDPVPGISISDATVTEGNAGTTPMTLTVSLSNPSDQTVTVHYQSADGTATVAGGDYLAASGTASIPPNTLSTPVTVTVNGDPVHEADETLVVNLSAPANGTIADAQGAGTIGNDDAVPTLSINDVTLAEGNAGTASATFTLSLSGATDQAVTVDYQTADGTAAVADGDYDEAHGTVTFPALSTSRPLAVTIHGDTKFEPDEAFLVNLSNIANATMADPQGVGTLTNDDTEPTLSIDDVTVTEGNSGTVTATFIASLSNPSSQDVTVQYQTADGSATIANGDYAAATGTATIPAGGLTTTIDVTVVGDMTFEGDETFTVSLSSPAHATLLDGQGHGTITNDDTVLSLSIDDVTVTEGDAGTAFATFTVTLSNATDQTVTASYQTADGSATIADGDYDAASGVATIPAKSLTTTIAVTVNGDVRFEIDETFSVNLSSPANATIADGTGQGTITNDDEGEAPAIHVDFPNDPDVLLLIGAAYDLRWTASDNVGVTGVDLQLSRDSGVNWETLATGEANDGVYSWTATPPPTGAGTPVASALLKAIAHDAAGNTGTDVSDNPFAIHEPPTAVADVVNEFALSEVIPNPSAVPVRINYALPRPATVRLSVVDLQGREVAVLLDRELGPGRYHAIWNTRSDRGAAPAGVYFARYKVPGKMIVRRFAIVR